MENGGSKFLCLKLISFIPDQQIVEIKLENLTTTHFVSVSNWIKNHGHSFVQSTPCFYSYLRKRDVYLVSSGWDKVSQQKTDAFDSSCPYPNGGQLPLGTNENPSVSFMIPMIQSCICDH